MRKLGRGQSQELERKAEAGLKSRSFFLLSASIELSVSSTLHILALVNFLVSFYFIIDCDDLGFIEQGVGRLLSEYDNLLVMLKLVIGLFSLTLVHEILR